MRYVVQRLSSGDEYVVEALATQTPPTRVRELLSDEKVFFVVAFADERPIGFVLAYELVRRHGDPSTMFVYEVDVDEAHRRSGVGTLLMRELRAAARDRSISSGFVLTNSSNESAMHFYESVGGKRPNTDDVLWDFRFEES